MTDSYYSVGPNPNPKIRNEAERLLKEMEQLKISTTDHNQFINWIKNKTETMINPEKVLKPAIKKKPTNIKLKQFTSSSLEMLNINDINMRIPNSNTLEKFQKIRNNLLSSTSTPFELVATDIKVVSAAKSAGYLPNEVPKKVADKTHRKYTQLSPTRSSLPLHSPSLPVFQPAPSLTTAANASPSDPISFTNLAHSSSIQHPIDKPFSSTNIATEMKRSEGDYDYTIQQSAITTSNTVNNIDYQYLVSAPSSSQAPPPSVSISDEIKDTVPSSGQVEVIVESKEYTYNPSITSTPAPLPPQTEVKPVDPTVTDTTVTVTASVIPPPPSILGTLVNIDEVVDKGQPPATTLHLAQEPSPASPVPTVTADPVVTLPTSAPAESATTLPQVGSPPASVPATQTTPSVTPALAAPVPVPTPIITTPTPVPTQILPRDTPAAPSVSDIRYPTLAPSPYLTAHPTAAGDHPSGGWYYLHRPLEDPAPALSSGLAAALSSIYTYPSSKPTLPSYPTIANTNRIQTYKQPPSSSSAYPYTSKDTPNMKEMNLSGALKSFNLTHTRNNYFSYPVSIPIKQGVGSPPTGSTGIGGSKYKGEIDLSNLTLEVSCRRHQRG